MIPTTLTKPCPFFRQKNFHTFSSLQTIFYCLSLVHSYFTAELLTSNQTPAHFSPSSMFTFGFSWLLRYTWGPRVICNVQVLAMVGCVPCKVQVLKLTGHCDSRNKRTLYEVIRSWRVLSLVNGSNAHIKEASSNIQSFCLSAFHHTWSLAYWAHSLSGILVAGHVSQEWLLANGHRARMLTKALLLTASPNSINYTRMSLTNISLFSSLLTAEAAFLGMMVWVLLYPPTFILKLNHQCNEVGTWGGIFKIYRMESCEWE